MITKHVKLLIHLILSQVYQLLWLLIHFVFRWQYEIREKLHTNYRIIIQRLFACLPTHSYYGELNKLSKATEALTKRPKHVAFSVVENVTVSRTSDLKGRRRGHPDRNDEEPIDLQLLARVISWAWVARVSVVSLYDYNGRLKKSHRELGCYIQEEVIQNYWALKKYDRVIDLPAIKFHNVPKLNGYSNGYNTNTNGVHKTSTPASASTSSPLHIVFFSYEDGKSDLIRATKLLYFDHISATKKLKSSSPLLLTTTTLSVMPPPTSTLNQNKEHLNKIQNQSDSDSDIENKSKIDDDNGNDLIKQYKDQDDSVSSSKEIETEMDDDSNINNISSTNYSVSKSESKFSSHCNNSIHSTNVELELEHVKEIDEKKLDTVLNRNHSWPSLTGVSADPDVLLILGNIQSTLGFLPWHIRLTEIHWLPKLEIVETKDFLQVLREYSRCEQRFGS